MKVKLKCRLGFSRFLLLIFTFFTAMAEKKKKPGDIIQKGVDRSKTKF